MLSFIGCQSTDTRDEPNTSFFYLVMIIDIKHKEVYQDYISLASRIEIPGKILAMDPNAKLLEGKGLGTEIHIIQFKTEKLLMDFYKNSNLKGLKQMRNASSKSSYFIVSGL